MNLAALLTGILFGVGLLLSDMTNPNRVIGFLDITGTWDPTLGFVMLGAIGVHLTFLRLWNRNTPLFDSSFHGPLSSQLDSRLLIGAGLFGLGWGLAGFCPGPALLGLFSFEPGVLAFGTAMLVSMFVTRRLLPSASTAPTLVNSETEDS